MVGLLSVSVGHADDMSDGKLDVYGPGVETAKITPDGRNAFERTTVQDAKENEFYKENDTKVSDNQKMVHEIINSYSPQRLVYINHVANGFVTAGQYIIENNLSGEDATRTSLFFDLYKVQFGGYVITEENVSKMLQGPINKYSPFNRGFYIFLSGQPIDSDVTQKITVHKNGEEVDETPRTVTGTKDYTGQFILDKNIFDSEKEKLVDEEGNDKAVVSPSDSDSLPFKNAFSVTLGGKRTADYTIIPKDDVTAIIHYQFANGQKAAPSKLVYGPTGTTQKVTSPTVSGYTPDQAMTEVTFGTDRKELTVTYTPTPTNTGNNTDAGTTTTPDQVTKPFKSFMIYAKRALYQYPSATFKASQRQQFHRHQPRIKADTFKVIGTVKSTAGRLRYHLSDGSYVTANPDYVANLYWQGQSYQRIKVTNPRGTYQYKQTTFKRANRQTYLKKGTVVKVTQVIHKGYMTRYQLANGQYITGNKQWVTPLA